MNRRVLGTALLLGVLGTAAADDWPQWRGRHRDGLSEEAGLLQKWPPAGPKLLWKAGSLGDTFSYSTAAVSRGRVYLLATQRDREVLIALSEETGRPLWTQPIGPVGKNIGVQYPGARSTPTVDGDLVFVLGSDGDLVCLDAEKGRRQWALHLRTDLGGVMGSWAYAESPLVDGDYVICTPGGPKATLAAIHKRSGKVFWKAAVTGVGIKAAYSSLVVGEVGGVRQYIGFIHGGLVGVEARTGKFLWRYTQTSFAASNVPTAIFKDGLVYSNSGKEGGVARLTAANGAFSAVPVYGLKELANKVGSAVLVDGHVYSAGLNLVCVEFATGKVKWSNPCVGPGSLCCADGCLYVRGEKGQVALVQASPRGYVEKGRFQQPERSAKPAWPPPVVANGRLYLRDQTNLLCYDVKAR